MSFATRPVRHWLSVLVAILLFGSLFVSLLMTSDALQSSGRFEGLFSRLLAVNGIALLALLVLIGVNVRQLIYQVRLRRAGARLTFRLLSLLVILSVVPVLVVYYFSIEFLNQRLDSWFDATTERGLLNALDLSRTMVDVKVREVVKQTEVAAMDLAETNKAGLSSLLDDLRNRIGATELTLLEQNGAIVASSVADTGEFLPNRSDDTILLQMRQSDLYFKIELDRDNGLHIRVANRLFHGPQARLLYAIFPIPEKINVLARNVEAAFVSYKERVYLRKPLKWSLTLVLSLVLLLSLFSVVWMAFFAVKRFVKPLSDLVEGTQAVANGNYGKQLPVARFDELGFLVQSFNEMTRKIAQARNEVEHSQRITENQRIYLEAVLGRLSSGVITLDYAHCLRTTNAAAEHILSIPLKELIGQSLAVTQDNYPTLNSLYNTIRPHLLSHAQDWREEVALFTANGRKILTCGGTQLQPLLVEGQTGGYVIVFDDVTALLQGQRNAAWGEVARRLAHEIKNPLTPIQLSAERLRQKYLQKLPEQERDTLDRMTHTIIQQVEALKEMVNAFSDYARTPEMRWQHLHLNHLIKEVLDLYHHEHPYIQMHLAEDLPVIQADIVRLRQVLHNLIKNALEANPGDKNLIVTTAYFAEPTFECVELRIQDQGPGVPTELLNHVFEPYFTTKTKGTGLGLAIVKKIVEEHGGMVWIENNHGACVVVRLPIISTKQSTVLHSIEQASITPP